MLQFEKYHGIERDGYLQEMESTYAGIQREEVGDVFDECRELGLVSPSGKILRS